MEKKLRKSRVLVGAKEIVETSEGLDGAVVLSLGDKVHGLNSRKRYL